MMEAASIPPRATRREWIGLAIIALMGSLVTAVYGSAFASGTIVKAVELVAAISAVMAIVMAAVIMSLLRPARAAV